MFSANSSQVSSDRLYVEDVFSTYLYTGTDATQTINNGIDLSGKGGLTWFKARNTADGHYLIDTARGGGWFLQSNAADGQTGPYSPGVVYSSTGFSTGTNTFLNASGRTFTSWTFRKAPKFFDVVTFTKNSSFVQNVPHSLGVEPGLVIVKATNKSEGWTVYHRSLGTGSNLVLNSTAAKNDYPGLFGGMDAETIGMTTNICEAGVQYVAYLFAHDTTSDGIIQCGSYTGTGSDLTVNLGWEPQWWLVKNATTAGWSWSILDNMRGFSAVSDNILQPNSSNAELTTTNISLTPTGVEYASTGNGAFNSSGATYIYIAIRRGPMRTPTSGTSVFSPVIYSGDNNANRIVSHTITPDAAIQSDRGYGFANVFAARLVGINTPYINYADAEGQQRFRGWAVQNGIAVGEYGEWNYNPGTPLSYVQLAFKRAPGFFDIVCYTGTGVANRQVTHNLGVVPELIMIKCRTASTNWEVLASSIPRRLNFNTTSSGSTPPPAIVFGDDTNYVSPTSSYFVIGTNGTVNSSANTYIAYLFSSCPGVSKVGSYTGNGSSQTIDCGFSAGARFFLVKRTDSTGDWWVYDSARGITASADPALKLNVDAEVTSADAVDPTSSGIIVNQESSCNINVSSATYIYLAVA